MAFIGDWRKQASTLKTDGVDCPRSRAIRGKSFGKEYRVIVARMGRCPPTRPRGSAAASAGSISEGFTYGERVYRTSVTNPMFDILEAVSVGKENLLVHLCTKWNQVLSWLNCWKVWRFLAGFRNFASIFGQCQYKRPECFVLPQLENGVVLGWIGH